MSKQDERKNGQDFQISYQQDFRCKPADFYSDLNDYADNDLSVMDVYPDLHSVYGNQLYYRYRHH